MASTFGTAYRNYNSSDTTYQTVQLGTANPYPQPLWDPPEGYTFLEWNTARDGTGDSRQAGQAFDGIETFYAIWYIPPKYYSVKTSDLIALVDAINAQNNTTAQLEWPQGYIDAIEIIGTFTFTIAGTTYRTKAGMTWEDWISSSYNTDGFYIYNSVFIKNNNGSLSLGYGNTAARKSDTIIENRAYILQSNYKY